MNEEKRNKLQRLFEFIICYINDNLDDTLDIKNCLDEVECIAKKLKKQCYFCKSVDISKYCNKLKIYFCKKCYKIHIKPNLKSKRHIKRSFFH